MAYFPSICLFCVLCFWLPYIGCSAKCILAAFDDVIANGVDIITISIGGTYAMPFQEDMIAIGTFHATEKGILTTNAAGNSGPKAGSVTSVAPWFWSKVIVIL